MEQVVLGNGALADQRVSAVAGRGLAPACAHGIQDVALAGAKEQAFLYRAQCQVIGSWAR